MKFLNKVKEFAIKNILIILTVLIIVILVILFLPSKNNSTNKNSNLSITLKGNDHISIVRGDNYFEAGYVAYDSKEGDLTSRVVVIGNVDTNTIGTYTLKYQVTNSEHKTSEVVRTINVVANLSNLDIEIDYSPKEITNSDVTINLKISGEGYDFILDPDGNINKSNELNYKVGSNDNYIFSIKRKDGVVIEKNIEIANIDKIKPTGSCRAILDKKTSIIVDAEDNVGITKYIYTIGNKEYESTKNSYTINGIFENINVTIYDEASNTQTITCDVNKASNVGEWPEFIAPTYPPDTTPKHFLENMEFNKRVRYLLYYPDNLDLSKKNPLVVYIHGAGECGANTSKMYRENGKFVNNMRKGRLKDAIYLAPQCNCQDGNFYICEKDFIDLINKVASEYNVNTNKISLTGISSGGSSAQRLLSKNPGFFSGAALLAPYITTGNADSYKNLKIAVFIGTLDALHNDGKAHSEILKSRGVDIKFYSVTGVGHVLESSVYDSTNVVEWLIAQEKK